MMEVYMSEEELKEYIENPDVVNSVIYAINLSLKVPEPQNIYTYFLTGHCNVYAEILVKVFEGHAIPCSNVGHIVVKIGEYYYDVEGIIPSSTIEPTEFQEMSNDELYDISNTGLGAFRNEIDDELIELGAAIGKEHLEELISIKFGSKKKH
jgi:hypothetical protein